MVIQCGKRGYPFSMFLTRVSVVTMLEDFDLSPLPTS